MVRVCARQREKASCPVLCVCVCCLVLTRTHEHTRTRAHTHTRTHQGTGRFASFVKQNCPDLRMDVLDLSPFYLAEAKKLLSKCVHKKNKKNLGRALKKTFAGL